MTDNRSQYSMGFYKFLIYFSLWAFALFAVLYGERNVMDALENDPEHKTVIILLGTGLTALAALIIKPRPIWPPSGKNAQGADTRLCGRRRAGAALSAGVLQFGRENLSKRPVQRFPLHLLGASRCTGISSCTASSLRIKKRNLFALPPSNGMNRRMNAMKKAVLFILAVGCLTLLLAGAASAESRVILYTYYRQVGWGDRVQIGWVEEDGDTYLVTGFDSDLHWPYKTEEQLNWLQDRADRAWQGKSSVEKLFNLKSLILSIEDQGSQSHPAACDAGTEKSFAVQYDLEDAAQCVLLGMSGDDCFENFDPDAQALYRYLRLLFPEVTCYAGSMDPAGFMPVPIRQFCNIREFDANLATISACYIDCEEGPKQLTVSEEERQSILRIILNGKVIGKDNATVVTGGTTSCWITDPEGNELGSIELYKGLLVRDDGMYRIEYE